MFDFFYSGAYRSPVQIKTARTPRRFYPFSGASTRSGHRCSDRVLRTALPVLRDVNRNAKQIHNNKQICEICCDGRPFYGILFRMNGIGSVLVIFFIFSVGFVFSRFRLWPDNATDVLSAIILKIAAPALAIVSISDRFTPEMLRESLLLLLISLMHLALMYCFGKCLSRLLGLRSGKRTVFEITFTFSNVIFIGLPINEITFGPAGLPYLFAYYIVSLTAFWSVGAYEMAKASPKAERRFSPAKIFSPGLVGVIIGVFFAELQLRFPSPAEVSLRYMSALCVPLSILVIGAKLVAFFQKAPSLSPDDLVILAGKFLFSPLLMFLLLRAFGVSGLAFSVLLLSSSMPCHMQTSILAQYYGVESEYAAKAVGMSTVLCLFTIPAYIALLGRLA
jgi:predicted permease